MSGRAEALSDGVFAIAMTLLVFDLRPPSAEAALGAELGRSWTALLAFAVSFLYLGVYWLNHTIALRLTRPNGPFLVVNLLFLMTISFVPFPTGILADRLASRVDLPFAAAFYGAAMLLPALVGSANWTYALRVRLLRADGISPSRARELARLYWLGPVLYLVAIVVALVLPALALAFYVVAPVLYLVVGARSRELVSVGA